VLVVLIKMRFLRPRPAKKQKTGPCETSQSTPSIMAYLL
jgi:hypothetical protein